MGEHVKKEGGTSMKFMVMIFIAFTIALGVMLVIRVVPIVKLTLKIKKVKWEIGRFSRHWKKVEHRFICDRQFREKFTRDPSKMGSFLKIVDSLNQTDFCKGLSSQELSGLFVANPDVMHSRVEEYLCYRKAAKI